MTLRGLDAAPDRATVLPNKLASWLGWLASSQLAQQGPSRFLSPVERLSLRYRKVRPFISLPRQHITVRMHALLRSTCR